MNQTKEFNTGHLYMMNQRQKLNVSPYYYDEPNFIFDDYLAITK